MTLPWEPWLEIRSSHNLHNPRCIPSAHTAGEKSASYCTAPTYFHSIFHDIFIPVLIMVQEKRMSLAAPNWYKRHCLLNSNAPWLGVFVGGGSTKRYMGVWREVWWWFVQLVGWWVWTTGLDKPQFDNEEWGNGISHCTYYSTYLLASKFKSIQ